MPLFSHKSLIKSSSLRCNICAFPNLPRFDTCDDTYRTRLMGDCRLPICWVLRTPYRLALRSTLSSVPPHTPAAAPPPDAIPSVNITRSGIPVAKSAQPPASIFITYSISTKSRVEAPPSGKIFCSLLLTCGPSRIVAALAHRAGAAGNRTTILPPGAPAWPRRWRLLWRIAMLDSL